MRTVLIATLGETPQVLTETVWALAHNKNPVLPDEVLAVVMENTSSAAAAWCFKTRKAWPELLRALKDDGFDLADKLKFGRASFSVANYAGEFINDLWSQEDNLHFAEYLFGVIKSYTDASDCKIILSISGGRKSMCSISSSVMSLLARPQDKMMHVMVRKSLEADREFVFPRKKKESDALTLFEVPFVRMRDLVGTRDRSFQECMLGVQKNIDEDSNLPEVVLDVEKQELRINGLDPIHVTLPYCLLYFMLMLSPEKWNHQRRCEAMKAIYKFGQRNDIGADIPEWFKKYRNDERLRHSDKDMVSVELFDSFVRRSASDARSLLKKKGVPKEIVDSLCPPKHCSRNYPRNRIRVRHTKLSELLYLEAIRSRCGN